MGQATGRPWCAQSCVARRTSAAFEGASLSRSGLTLSLRPVRVWPPSAIGHSLTSIWCRLVPAPHHSASGAIRFSVSTWNSKLGRSTGMACLIPSRTARKAAPSGGRAGSSSSPGRYGRDRRPRFRAAHRISAFPRPANRPDRANASRPVSENCSIRSQARQSRAAPGPEQPAVETCRIIPGQCLRIPSIRRANCVGVELGLWSSLRRGQWATAVV